LSSGLASYLSLNARILYWIFIAPWRGTPLRLSHIIQQIIRIGVQAIPMASLTALSIGFTLAMEGSKELGRVGAADQAPSLVALTLLRELGPMLICVIVIGRSGSAVTAELGTMKVSEEIEALRIMAIDPVRFLVVPRFLAMLIMLPVMTVFGNYIGMFGGWIISHGILGMDTSNYVLGCLERAHPWDLWTGIIKSFIFAWLVITIACDTGLNVEGGAEGVGTATTASVVNSLLAMLVANAILTAIFFFT